MRPDVRFPLTPLAAILLSCAAGAAAQTPEADARPLLRLERSLGAGRAPSEEPTPVYARADRARGELEERVILEGNAEVRRAGTVLRGDRMTYTVATDEVEVEGNARIFSDGTVFTGPRLAFRIDAQTGTMPEANFSYAPRQGRGTSKLIEFLGETVRVTDATYTSCRPGDDAWWIKANRLDLDRVEELAVARGAAIYFQGVPIFASPYFQFPLGDRRRTGLLTPSFSFNSKLGPEVEVPWYWNIAPNRDLTLAPRFMSRRGVLLQSEARYLEPRFRGTLDFDIIPKDRVDGGSREHVSWRHDYVHSSGVASGINYNQVSDDRFFVDFSRTIVGAATAVLPQEAFVSYGRTFWNTSLRVTKNQALTSLLAAGELGKPYERVPQYLFSTFRNDWAGFDVGATLDATQFSHPALENGARLILNPSVSYPWIAPGWFIVPKVQWHYTSYTLDRDFHPLDRRPSRSLPIASLDGGLIFERDGTWFGADILQTLEPRLYYAYIPYRDQSELPNFDSALADFNFAQLFTENVFVGGDRIGEARQLTAAVVARVIDPATGAERMRAALGQRFYFGSQRVTLPGGAGRRDDKESDVLLTFTGRVARNWLVDTAVQHSTLENQVVRSSMGVRWQPAPAKALSVAYRYRIEDLEQVDVAAQWPLDFIGLPHVYGVGRANYSFRDARWVETLAGFEYKADCWVLRFAAQRFATAPQTATTAVFLQLELNGLSSIGSSPVEQLRRNIPGYQVINPPPAQPGRYDYYE